MAKQLWVVLECRDKVPSSLILDQAELKGEEEKPPSKNIEHWIFPLSQINNKVPGEWNVNSSSC